MTVLVLENCPSLITYSQVEKRKILEMLSNIILSSKNVKLRKAKEFFFARFLKSFKFKFYSTVCPEQLSVRNGAVVSLFGILGTSEDRKGYYVTTRLSANYF